MADVAIESAVSISGTVSSPSLDIYGLVELSSTVLVEVEPTGALTSTTYLQDVAEDVSVLQTGDLTVDVGLEADVRVTGDADDRNISFRVTGSASLNSLAADVRDVIDEIFLLWAHRGGGSSGDCHLRDHAIRILNASVQFVASRSKELNYLHQASRAYALSEGANSVTLERDVQHVEGPVRWKPPVLSVATRSTNPYTWRIYLGDTYGGSYTLNLTVSSTLESITIAHGATSADVLAAFETHSRVSSGDITVSGSGGDFIVTTTYTSGAALAVNSSSGLLAGPGYALTPIPARDMLDRFHQIFPYTSGIPAYYHTDVDAQTGVPEMLSVSLLFRPQALIGDSIPVGDIVADLAVEAPRFVWSDYSKGSPIPMPHSYVESLLIPICRYRAMQSHYFIRNEVAPAIQAAYQTALEMFGIVDPAASEERVIQSSE